MLLETLGFVLLIVYCLAMVFVTAFCLAQLYLLYHAGKRRHSGDPGVLTEHPFVTIQLPVYNEPHVIERLIDATCAMDYPKDMFEIQILDDSTDETAALIDQKVKACSIHGHRIRVLRRAGRSGYKAGALEFGLQQATGSLIAIFDADFLPDPGFLKQILPHFKDPDVAVVQSRWSHLNENASLLTRLLAFQLNIHFLVEQPGRSAADVPLQFNGTAGIWRKSAIIDAGGWQGDTLTEDLDLSYRAQLRHWRVIYVKEIISPAELPACMPAVRSQQFRWMKGGAETARKLLPAVWRSGFSLRQKMMATQHLLGSSVFICIFLIALLSFPVLLTAPHLGVDLRYFSLCTTGFMAMTGVFFVANKASLWSAPTIAGNVARSLYYLPAFLALSMGLSLQNSVAVLQGYAGKKSAFIRTPKFGAVPIFGHKSYLSSGPVSRWTYAEGMLAIYYLVAVIYALVYADYAFVPFHLLLMTGFSAICYYSIRHSGV